MPLTDTQKQIVDKLYANTMTQDLADTLCVSISVVRNYVHKAGLKKSKEWVAENSRRNMMREDHPGRMYWIKKGSIPINKGLKQSEYMSADAIEKTKATRFKNGQKCHNAKPVGHFRITKDGYIEVKVAEPNVFKLKHRMVWEKHNGEIPKGYNVQFKDGDRTNVEIDNLYIISRSEQITKNNSMFAKYPKDVQLAILAMGVLNRQINKLTKK